MSDNAGPKERQSPLAILTELAVEGTSSFIEAQRIFLNLVQKENDLLMNGVKERVGGSTPMAAMTDLARRSVDTLVNMQHGFLTTSSKQALQLLESVQAGKGYRGGQVVVLAREAMENFVHAQKQFLDVLTQETLRATRGKREQSARPVQKTELSKLAREAGDLLIDAQKKVLDVLGQQMNVNLNAATQAVETLSPAHLAPMAEIPVRAVKSFFDSQNALLQSVIGPHKKSKVGGPKKRSRTRTVKHQTTA